MCLRISTSTLQFAVLNLNICYKMDLANSPMNDLFIICNHQQKCLSIGPITKWICKSICRVLNSSYGDDLLTDNSDMFENVSKIFALLITLF